MITKRMLTRLINLGEFDRVRFARREKCVYLFKGKRCYRFSLAYTY